MDAKLIAMSPIFRGLNGQEVTELLSVLPHKKRKFKAGALIAQAGETVSSLMIVSEGLVKGEMTDYAGRVIKIEDIPAPGALAPAFMFGPVNSFPVNVKAVSDCELLVVNRPDFLRLLVGDERILINFLNLISGRSQFLSEKIKFLNFKTIRGKLAQYILQRAENTSGSIRLDRTQNDLADFFGVARPSIARALSEMEKEQLIKATGKNISIIDRKGLTLLTND